MPRAKRERNLAKRMTADIRESFDSAKDKIEEARDETEVLIKRNPWASIAVAAAVGAVVALGINAVMREEKRSFARRFRDYFD